MAPRTKIKHNIFLNICLALKFCMTLVVIVGTVCSLNHKISTTVIAFVEVNGTEFLLSLPILFLNMYDFEGIKGFPDLLFCPRSYVPFGRASVPNVM